MAYSSFFDVEGASLVPDGPSMREKPTLLLLHGGPGFDHSIYKPAYSSREPRHDGTGLECHLVGPTQDTTSAMSADRVGRTWGRVVAVSALPLLSWPSVTGSLRSKRTHPIGSKADELQPGRSQLLVRDAELGIPGDLQRWPSGSPVGIIAHSWNACLRHGQPPLAAKPPCGAYWEQCRERASWRATRSCTSPLTSLLSAENAAKLNATS